MPIKSASTKVTSTPRRTTEVSASSDGACLLRVVSVAFNDGTTIRTEDASVTVFCGPNNAGKSLVLREIEDFLHRDSTGKVLSAVKDKRVGTTNQISSHVYKNSRAREKNQNSDTLHLYGLGFHIIESSIARKWASSSLDDLADFFIESMPTETRIQDSDPIPNVAHNEAPEHPLHYLHGNFELTKQISQEFQKVFGREIIVDYGAGSEVSMRVGVEPSLNTGITPVSRSYIDQLHTQTVRIEDEGDGVRSFSTILLRSLATPFKQIFFLDEPEAFLHPPQAKLLGEFIARHSLSGKQIFVATHSIDILEGIMSVAGANITLARIDRDKDINRLSYLDPAQGAHIWSDPVARHSGLLEAVFHKRAIICESDADCLFYSLIGKAVDSDTFGQKELFFSSSNGKSGIPKYAQALRALGVPTCAVADIDVLSDTNLLRIIFESLGGIWSEVEKDVGILRKAIESKKPLLNARDVAHLISNVVSSPPDTVKDLKITVNSVFSEANPWDFLKQAGRAGVPSGDPMKAFDRLMTKFQEAGLWVVPVGEIEGFCRSASASHGPRFIRTILETRDLANDPELEEARIFVSALLA